MPPLAQGKTTRASIQQIGNGGIVEGASLFSNKPILKSQNTSQINS